MKPFYEEEVFITGEASKDSSHRCKRIHKLVNLNYQRLEMALSGWVIDDTRSKNKTSSLQSIA